ncbi:hypothetical protein BDV41DRAFT_229993 [Aspergillus transmontanensis]|uniref:Uncharacterized protein n=1 Tax=Aspergillus transmontanensis TaxID=1034304 RepID=A0A5N6WEN6_9EURO|nr:hypothetical protein BDV41DRAFT_229993 [Aspergillus transmontanensis]
MLVRVMGEMISTLYEGFNIQKMKFCFCINSFRYSYNFREGDSPLSATELYSLTLPVNQGCKWLPSTALFGVQYPNLPIGNRQISKLGT